MTKSDTTSKAASSGWHIALQRSKAGEDKPYLGDPEVVDGLVRSFVKDICDRFAEVADGGMFAQDAAAKDTEACTAMGRILAGEDPGFTPVGSWNGAPCADYCVKTMPDYIKAEATPAETIAQAFAVLVHSVYDVFRDVDEGGDQDDAGLTLQGYVEDWTRMVMGIPHPD